MSKRLAEIQTLYGLQQSKGDGSGVGLLLNMTPDTLSGNSDINNILQIQTARVSVWVEFRKIE